MCVNHAGWDDVFCNNLDDYGENRDVVGHIVRQVINAHKERTGMVPRAQSAMCEAFPYIRAHVVHVEESRGGQAAKAVMGSLFAHLVEYVLDVLGIRYCKEYEVERADGTKIRLDFVLFDSKGAPFCYIEAKTRPRARRKEYEKDCTELNLPMNYLIASGEDESDKNANTIGRVCVSDSEQVGEMLRAIVRRANQ